LHELSVAQSICESVLREIGGAGNGGGRRATGPGVRVESMAIEVGALSGVNRDALEFAMPIAAETCGLPLDVFEIEGVPAHATCSCGHEYEPDDLLAPCPQCGGFDRAFDGGMDVAVSKLVVVPDL
jgi:hydrogenase nickel incorporation protein HypA/HybF